MREDRQISVPIVILGLGNVGRMLIRQILDNRNVLARRANLRMVITGLADSRALLLDRAGLPDDTIIAALQVKTDGGALNMMPESQPINVGATPLSHTTHYERWRALEGVLQPGTILVDVTASTETAPILQAALDAGCGVVLANKHPLSRPWPEVQTILGHRRLRYEATVGAGLPVIAALYDLLDTSDRVTAIEGCLSGTLGYLCTQLEDGASYSVAVSQARSLGYTEPDPREDLSGRDVARKALILARTAGWPLETADLRIEPLYPEPLADIPTEEFMAAAYTLDAPYAHRVEQARARGQALRYVARITPDGGEVGLTAVPKDSALGALRGPANHVTFYTDRYAELGLTISGPGAGPEVTAAGVLADIIKIANDKV